MAAGSPVPEAMVTCEEDEEPGPATSDVWESMLNPNFGPANKDILERTLVMVSIEKAGRALKELFHPDSDAAKVVRAELTSRLERLKGLQKEENGEGKSQQVSMFRELPKLLDSSSSE